MERKLANGIASYECYSIEKEANKHHSGRLINQDQSARIEVSYITSTCMISVLFTLDFRLHPRSGVIAISKNS